MNNTRKCISSNTISVGTCLTSILHLSARTYLWIVALSCSRTNRMGNRGTENICMLCWFQEFLTDFLVFLFLYSGGVSYALFISLLISKLFCTVQRACLGRGGGEGPVEGVAAICSMGWFLKIETFLSPEMATNKTWHFLSQLGWHSLCSFHHFRTQ